MVVESSTEQDESTLIPGLERRVRQFGQSRRQVQAQQQIVEAPEVSDGGLQEMFDEVAGQAPGSRISSGGDCSSSKPDDEKCGVCERSFRHRGPILKCAGCAKDVHRNFCVTYMKLSPTYRAGVCNLCKDQVENWIEEVKEYTHTSGFVWNQDDWLKRLVKSHSRGMELSRQAVRPFNRLQKFIWLALGRGLRVREDYAPFAPVSFSRTVTEGSGIATPRVATPGGSNAAQAQDVRSDQGGRQRAPTQQTPPWQTPPGGSEQAGEPTIPRSRRESQTHQEIGARDAGSSNQRREEAGARDAGSSYQRRESQTQHGARARDAGSSYHSKGGKGVGGSYNGKGSRATPGARSEVGSQRREAYASPDLGREERRSANEERKTRDRDWR